MGVYTARGEEFEKIADKKINGWSLFGSKYEDAADLYEKAANNFKLAKAWDRAAAAYMKKAECHSKLENHRNAASAYVDAAHACRKNPSSSSKEAVSCLEKAVFYFLETAQIYMAAKYYKEIAELYESMQDLVQAMANFEESADLFKTEDATGLANQCLQKVAECAARLEQYSHAIEVYEAMALEAREDTLYKYRVKEYLLNAGLCKLCKGDDVVAISKSLARYENLDPCFAGTLGYKFLADLAAAVDADDVAQFTHLVKQFDGIPSQLDELKTVLLLRVKQKLKAKELEEDDLT